MTDARAGTKTETPRSPLLIELPEPELNDILDAVGAEVGRALVKFPAINSPHEGWAVIREEVDELWDEVKRQRQDRAAMRREAVQVAAMAVRFLHDLPDESSLDAFDAAAARLEARVR